MGCNCNPITPPEVHNDEPQCSDRSWEDVRWRHHDWSSDDCSVPGRICAPKEHDYFTDYSDVEKKVIAEQLGFAAGNVNVQNYPDGEDLEESVKYNYKVLRLRDKDYVANSWGGLGRKYLRQNLKTINGTVVNVLSQEMFENSKGQPLDHTRFIIQYDYDLDGAIVRIPADSILDFGAGGSFSNGTIFIDNTTIYPLGYDLKKFDDKSLNINYKGQFANGQIVTDTSAKTVSVFFGGLKYDLKPELAEEQPSFTSDEKDDNTEGGSDAENTDVHTA